MLIYRVRNNELSSRQLQEVTERLDKGDIMIYPTDTLYAIGCDALNVKAVEKICRLQGIRPEKTNLSIICKDISQAAEYTRIDNKCFRLMRDNTPGPFTFIFRAGSNLPKTFKGRKEVGVRIPECPAPLQIVEELDRPLLTASIHCEDEDYLINPELIAEAYEGRVDFMILGEAGGVEPSTIVNCIGASPEITREGKGLLVE